jgi:hypothetical protein
MRCYMKAAVMEVSVGMLRDRIEGCGLGGSLTEISTLTRALAVQLAAEDLHNASPTDLRAFQDFPPGI